MQNVRVDWSIVSGGGKITQGTNNTNSSGIATNTWKLGATGTQQVIAVVKKTDGTDVTGSPGLFSATIAVCYGPSTVTDIDGNIYNVITIGNQCWMQQNLKTTRYNDGSAIPTDLSDAAWGATTSGAYAIYDNNAANNTTYGKLYNWYAVNTGKLAPSGWHVPTDAEWTTLITYLGGESVAGVTMKATALWEPSPGITNTNSSGFTGLPAGLRLQGEQFGIGDYGIFWSSTESSTTNALYRYLTYDGSGAARYDYNEANGFSVRCVRD